VIAEVVDLLFDGPISGIWPIVCVPLLSALLCDRAARALPLRNADWRVAAILAALPGLIMAILITGAAVRSLFHLGHGDWLHAVEHHFIWLVGPALLLPAFVGARRRSRSLAALVRLAHEPESRLAAAARKVRVECRQLPAKSAECFVAGLRRPIAFVSHGALKRLSNEELEAALRHEKAHIDGKDLVIHATLSFLADLAGSSNRAMSAYKQACERRADRRSVAAADPVSLASALVVFSRSEARGVLGMAGLANGTWRIEALLDSADEAAEPLPLNSRTMVAMNVPLLAWPALHTGIAYLFCSS
jgi:Zn-dependent protease with chaperone function